MLAPKNLASTKLQRGMLRSFCRQYVHSTNISSVYLQSSVHLSLSIIDCSGKLRQIDACHDHHFHRGPKTFKTLEIYGANVGMSMFGGDMKWALMLN